MVRRRLERHKYKIVVGVPMAFLLASSLSLVRDAEEMCIVPEDNRFVEVGETVTLHLIASSQTPINVVAATVDIPTDHVKLDALSREQSIIDLWTQEPRVIEDSSITFAGGIVRPGGFVGDGVVLTLTVRPIMEGTASFNIRNVEMLAHDGTGRPVDCAQTPITLSVRPAAYPSPDVNGDSYVNLFDFGLVSSRIFLGYSQKYDLNMDGRITIADVAIIINSMTTGGQQTSLALLSRKDL